MKRLPMLLRTCNALLLAAGLGALAQAASIRSFSPQGEVADVRQVVVQFDAAVVNFGDARVVDAMQLTCDDAAPQGAGRWVSAREWVFDFDQLLPDGVVCAASLNPDFKPLNGTPGEALTGTTRYAFQTGGPRVLGIHPADYYYDDDIDEEQYFVLKLSAPVSLASLREHMWCVSESVGERIGVRLADEADRTLLVSRYYHGVKAAENPQQYPVVACNRRLTAGSPMQLVFGAGVATATGVAGKTDRVFDYRVRREFAAEFTCERENAQSACLPNRPMRLRFSAPVPVAQLADVYLQKKVGNAVGEDALLHIFPALTDADKREYALRSLKFAPTFEENQRYTLVLPAGMTDDADRPLVNAAQFPLEVGTSNMPPLVKFAAAPFGIIERYAEGWVDGVAGPALLPVTVRNVEPELAASVLNHAQAPAASNVHMLRVDDDDADIIDWLERVSRYHSGKVSRLWAVDDGAGPLPPPPPESGNSVDYLPVRTLSLLDGRQAVQTLALPQSDPSAHTKRPFEVIGIPLERGFHVVEIGSPLLGRSLLGQDQKMVVRTAVLVTNLAVHFKEGQENSLAWVTRLDDGSVVPGARVQVSNCKGEVLARSVTDASGVARFDALPPRSRNCRFDDYGYFVTARAPDPKADSKTDSQDDLAFVWSEWHDGIEPWRFDLPYRYRWSDEDGIIAHTVFDRTLLRAGETVAMKHLIRQEVGVAQGSLTQAPQDALPDTLLITHTGSALEYKQPLSWRNTAGGFSAESEFAIPAAARLGQYTVELVRAASRRSGYYEWSRQSGSFRVEEFRLPVLEGRVAPASQAALIAVSEVPVQVSVNYLSGGPAARLPVDISAMSQPQRLSYPGWEGFQFERWYARVGESDSVVVANKLPVTLDASGQGAVTLTKLPTLTRPRQLRLEASYADPSGETQTLSSTHTLWPAAVVAGIKAERWMVMDKKLSFQTLALDVNGQPQAGVPLRVEAISRTTTTSRKRLVGGFYSYDNQKQQTSLGVVCEGVSDAQGLLACSLQLTQPGEVELVVTATDAQNRSATASTEVWVSRSGHWWFAQDDHDRMDVLPEKREYQPGETARFQVRMPYREATALVSIEREGISHTQVVKLRGDDPTLELKVQPDWGPNVFVSVLALRGRIREAPWYSHLFTWSRDEAAEYRAPTALVDLSKPSFRLGVAEIRVGTAAHRIKVDVAPERERYQVRDTARVVISATLPDGKPAAHAEVAVAAVDQALLELAPNRSWNLLEAMLSPRRWGVTTATAQMEIIGRRHYGRKAVAPGGDGAGSGGPRSQQRTLFDTLLLWQPRVQLDENGQATVEVPLNDSLTRFQIVAVAEHGATLFGTGRATITATQDLQIVSGLPPLVRAGDTFHAPITLRNTSEADMRVALSASAVFSGTDLGAMAGVTQTWEAEAATPILTSTSGTDDRRLLLPAGQALSVNWPVDLRELPPAAVAALTWEINAVAERQAQQPVQDSLKLTQRIVPAVPLTVLQGTLIQLDGQHNIPVAPPAGAIAGSGGLALSLAPTLATGLSALRDWWQRYPYTCLEQTTSRAVGLQDAQTWQTMMQHLPVYLDHYGLASYFPLSSSGSGHYGNRGYDALTAHLLTLSAQMQKLDARFVIPQAERRKMMTGLSAFITGRIPRLEQYSPRRDLEARKIAAMQALAVSDDQGEYGKTLARAIDTIRIAPNEWPTHTVIDWIGLLTAMPASSPNDPRAEQIRQAQQVLRARLNYQGTRVGFSNEDGDNWWWLMHSADTNLARLILLNLEASDWQADMPRLVSGFIARQQHGAWRTTTANLWGGLALQRFSQRFESEPVTGLTHAQLGQTKTSADWANITPITQAELQTIHDQHDGISPLPVVGSLKNNTLSLPWSALENTGSQAGSPRGSPRDALKGTLSLTQQGTGKPWVTLQSLASVPYTEPVNAGYRITREVAVIDPQNPLLPEGHYSRGDILRVTLTIHASADMNWVALTDPIPAGATILGSGLGRDSQIATTGESAQGRGHLAWLERSFENWRGYYSYLPRGDTQVQYTLRLNQTGDFTLPATRIEALYAPEMYGVAPNGRVRVGDFAARP